MGILFLAPSRASQHRIPADGSNGARPGARAGAPQAARTPSDLRYDSAMQRTLLLLALVPLLAAAASSPLPPPADRDLAREMLKTLVEIDTTHAHGSTAAAEAIRGWLLSAGF